MRAEERDAIVQRWRSVFQREIRELASLEQTAARALNDPDVRTDSILEGIILAEIENRRAAFGQGEQRPPPSPAAKQARPTVPPASPRPTATVPRDPAWAAFDQLARILSGFLVDSDEDEALAVAERMRLLHEENPGAIPAAAMEPYEGQIGKLRTHLEHRRGEIAALVQQIVAASRHGDENAVASLMIRLSAIHVGYPRLLDEARWEEIRSDIIDAAEEHEDGLRVHKLIDRERVLAAEIKKLAGAVQEFHRAARLLSHTSEQYRSAEAAYLRTVQEVRAHDPEWVAGVVLELGDMLAECAVLPPGAAARVDRFLDSISSSLGRIRAAMHGIKGEQESDDGDASTSAAP